MSASVARGAGAGAWFPRAADEQADRAGHHQQGQHDEDGHGDAMHHRCDRQLGRVASSTHRAGPITEGSAPALLHRPDRRRHPDPDGARRRQARSRSRRLRSSSGRSLAETDEHGGALDNYFARARSIILLTANSPAFANVLAEPGHARAEGAPPEPQPRRGHAPARLSGAAVPDEHRRGVLHRRARRGVRARGARRGRAPRPISRRTEEQTVFFAPTFALGFGQVHQTRPYVSPDTKEWVVANATLIPQPDGRKRAFVHFEVTVESFRRAMGRRRRGSAGSTCGSSTAAPAGS